MWAPKSLVNQDFNSMLNSFSTCGLSNGLIEQRDGSIERVSLSSMSLVAVDVVKDLLFEEKSSLTGLRKSTGHAPLPWIVAQGAIFTIQNTSSYAG